MKRDIRLMVFAMLALFASVATATTYQYTGPAYTTAGGVYTTSMRVTGTFTTAKPLQANMPPTAIGPGGSDLVTAWSFNDGVNTFTQADSMVIFGDPMSFTVGTDADGNINTAQIGFMAPRKPHVKDELMNAFAFDTGSFVQAVTRAPCGKVDGTSSTCVTISVQENYARADLAGGIWTIRETAASVAPVPTLNSMFLAALAVGLAALSYLSLRRRI